MLNYNYQINKDNFLDAMVGLSTMIHTVKDLALLVPGLPTDDFMDLEYTSKEEGKRSMNSSHSRQHIMSFFGRVNVATNPSTYFLWFET
ncbi:hypothetical protein NXY34_23505 [Bacteroides fragilis]|nr:hypothetical protein [Bacteroides fragilis]